MNLLHAAVLLGAGLAISANDRAGPEVRITLSKDVAPDGFTGRVFVLASGQPIKDVPPRQNWFKPYPFFAQDVKGWGPGEPLAFAPQHHFPHRLAELSPG